MISKNKAFSLIELLVVIAIMGILSSISFTFYRSYVTKTNLSLVDSVLRSAYAIVKDNQNFGISTQATELNAMSIPEKQHNQEKNTNPTTKVGTWRVTVAGDSPVTSIPISTKKPWCLQIRLGELAYDSSPSCIDSNGNINHKGQPLSTSVGKCKKVAPNPNFTCQ